MATEASDLPAGLAGLEPVDEDTLLRRLDAWSRNLVRIAEHVCGKKTEDVDERGHSKWPCEDCVKGVEKVTKYWFGALRLKAMHVQQRAEKESLDLPQVDLATAFFLATSVLDPATSVELEGWGAA